MDKRVQHRKIKVRGGTMTVLGGGGRTPQIFSMGSSQWWMEPHNRRSKNLLITAHQSRNLHHEGVICLLHAHGLVSTLEPNRVLCKGGCCKGQEESSPA